jgi:hypothetical protein
MPTPLACSVIYAMMFHGSPGAALERTWDQWMDETIPDGYPTAVTVRPTPALSPRLNNDHGCHAHGNDEAPGEQATAEGLAPVPPGQMVATDSGGAGRERPLAQGVL